MTWGDPCQDFLPVMQVFLCLKVIYRNSELALFFPHNEDDWGQITEQGQTGWSGHKGSTLNHRLLSDTRMQTVATWGYLSCSPEVKSPGQNRKGAQKHPEVPDRWEDVKGSELGTQEGLRSVSSKRCLCVYFSYSSSALLQVSLGSWRRSYAASTHRINFSHGGQSSSQHRGWEVWGATGKCAVFSCNISSTRCFEEIILEIRSKMQSSHEFQRTKWKIEKKCFMFSGLGLDCRPCLWGYCWFEVSLL